jgi:hypothetical protein
MVKKSKPNLTLDQAVVYQIRVPGHMDESWLDWFGEIAVKATHNETGQPITTLTSRLDQAALIGLLRRLYSLGLPLISVECLEV